MPQLYQLSPPLPIAPLSPAQAAIRALLPRLATYPSLPLLLLRPPFILDEQFDAGLGAQHLLQVLLQVRGLGLGAGQPR